MKKCACYHCRYLLMDSLDDPDAKLGWTPLWSCGVGLFEHSDYKDIPEMRTRFEWAECPSFQRAKRKTRRPKVGYQQKAIEAACCYLKCRSIRRTSKETGLSRQFVRRAIKQQESNADMG